MCRPVASFFDWGASGAVCAARHRGSPGGRSPPDFFLIDAIQNRFIDCTGQGQFVGEAVAVCLDLALVFIK